MDMELWSTAARRARRATKRCAKFRLFDYIQMYKLLHYYTVGISPTIPL
jgi:hypothetical protein